MATAPSYDLVLVSWADHIEHVGWTPTKKIKSGATAGQLVWSVGWLIANEDDYIIISPHVGLNDDEEEATGTMEILVETIEEFQIIRNA
jgi:hypothetical protein